MSNYTEEQRHVSVIYIKAAAEQVWEGLTNPEFTRRYFHATDIDSDWCVNSKVTYYNQDKSVAVEGRVLEVDKPNKLRISWHVHYNPEAKLEAPSQVCFLLEEVDDAIRLTVIHDQFPADSVVFPNIQSGWIAIISNLKTLLETESVMAIS